MSGGSHVGKTARLFAKFLTVGILNTIFGYAVYALLLWFGMPPQFALVVAFALGVAWNYFTTARLVFRVFDLKRFPAYVAAYLAVYVTNALSLQAALTRGFDPFLAQAILMPVFAVMAFVLLSFVFRGTSRSV